MVEHNLAKVGVASSSLVSRSKFRTVDFYEILQVTEKRTERSFFRSSDNDQNPLASSAF
ncbi:hypothetical protein XBP1_2990120 [Xenorhabdus bovienii str. puntauvense]|uniref:Uncharacterized protein n=2 Tax=Xenorhabdus bovienii TaxID=40576 RepID=A0A0B6XFY4_XENBV|nr:hypothetical protein XBFFR1_1840014 [Xenorhabdus bovienii str. feltiae France]CDG94030.1 hypothetical protein XBFFL1_310014 [Xenorhabdus bovienii str. feltiae Florida]CDG98336.1 hypothetical protein XBP1_2990120 [Xenorhabdus bovienii str. puntauvense]CDM91828.1 protein of unknown function [Xenorhabdus bovienii]